MKSQLTRRLERLESIAPDPVRLPPTRYVPALPSPGSAMQLLGALDQERAGVIGPEIALLAAGQASIPDIDEFTLVFLDDVLGHILNEVPLRRSPNVLVTAERTRGDARRG